MTIHSTFKMLSNQAIQKISQVMASEVVDDIYASEQWTTMMHEVIPDIITAKMGQLDDELLYELSLCVMDKIAPKVFS